MPDATRRQVSGPNVIINDRFLSQRISGGQRYARETILCLDELLANGEQENGRWTLLVPRGTPTPRFRHIFVDPLDRLRGHLWEQLQLPWRARNGLLFNFGLTGSLAHGRQIITVHDAAIMRTRRHMTGGSAYGTGSMSAESSPVFHGRLRSRASAQPRPSNATAPQPSACAWPRKGGNTWVV